MLSIWGCSQFFTVINNSTYFHYISAFLTPIILFSPQHSNMYHHLLSYRYRKFVFPLDKGQLTNLDGFIIKIKFLLNTLHCILPNIPSVSKSHLLFFWHWTQVTLKSLPYHNIRTEWILTYYFYKYLALFLSTVLTVTALTSCRSYSSWSVVQITLCGLSLTASLSSCISSALH